MTQATLTDCTDVVVCGCIVIDCTSRFHPLSIQHNRNFRELFLTRTVPVAPQNAICGCPESDSGLDRRRWTGGSQRQERRTVRAGRRQARRAAMLSCVDRQRSGRATVRRANAAGRRKRKR